MIKKTIEIIAENEGLTLSGLARKIGASPQNMYDIRSGKVSGVSSEIADKIISVYPQYTKIWIMTGEGDINNRTDKSNPDVIMVPVINLDARGGFGENDERGLEYITERMPFSRNIARDGDVVIPVFGDSMEPKFPSGSYILIRLVAMWQEYLELGASYVIELIDDRRVLKNIQRSDDKDKFLLESVNPKFEPMEIPKKMIRRIFQVLMSIKRETL